MNQSLERAILRYGLIVGIMYTVFLTILSIYPIFLPRNAIITVAISILLILLLLLVQYKKNTNGIALALHLITLAAFAYFWINYGGLAGAVPGFLCAYITFIVMTSSGYYLWISVAIFFIWICAFLNFPSLLGMIESYEPQHTNFTILLLDYNVIGGILVAFVYYFKGKFTYYRELVARRFHQLNKSSNTLYNQNQELAANEEETRAINDNLETIVEERTHQMEITNAELSEYAFINAHMLRGPLCRIIGLIHLMEKEPNKYDPHHISIVKEKALAIDTQIKAINKVLH